MVEWFTYRPEDLLPFSADSYFRLLELYNRQLWPWQPAVYVAGLVLAVLAGRHGRRYLGLILAITAGAWLWIAWGFHWRHYASINPTASAFAVLFALESILLVAAALVARRQRAADTRCDRQVPARVAPLLIIGAYPLTWLLDHRPWTQAELFVLSPDPTAAATIAMLLLLPLGGWRWLLLAIPSAWCLFSSAVLAVLGSTSAAVLLSMVILTVISQLFWWRWPA